MKIKYGQQIDASDINGEKIDLFLFANNTEERKFTSYSFIKRIACINKTYSLYYQNSKLESIEKVENTTVNSYEKLIEILDNELMSNIESTFTIFVDYSCMTKSWYYTILLYLSNKKLNKEKITVFFSYTPSVFSDPFSPKPNSEICPLPGKYIIPSNKPKALIVCLGYEENKAQGIIDQLDPALTFLFYTDPALDDKFVDVIKSNNKSILDEFEESYKITYPFGNLLLLEQKLSSVYFKLKDNYKIIIAPLGPKPFTLVSMILSIIFQDIEIWRVGNGEDINPYL